MGEQPVCFQVPVSRAGANGRVVVVVVGDLQVRAAVQCRASTCTCRPGDASWCEALTAGVGGEPWSAFVNSDDPEQGCMADGRTSHVHMHHAGLRCEGMFV